MAGARVALPVGGNPLTASALINFQLADGAGAGTPISILGWAVTETTGSSVAKIRFHDGSNASGPELAPAISLAAGGTVGPVSFSNPVQCASGKVYVEWISGSVEICLYW